MVFYFNNPSISQKKILGEFLKEDQKNMVCEGVEWAIGGGEGGLSFKRKRFLFDPAHQFFLS
jgi:hypothetical protein